VTVTNRRGEPVSDLTAADFEVREDGEPQTIQSFEFVRLNGAPTDERSLPIRSPEHAAAEAGRDDVRLFLIFWDEYHIDHFIPTTRGKQVLTDFVKSAFGPTDLVGMMDQLTTVDSIRFTRDWSTLVEQVHQLKGRLGILLPPRSAVEEAHLRVGRDIGRIRNEVTMTALQSAAAFLGTFREGRKSILFVSQGVAIFGRNGETEMFRELIETANDNNTAIYTLDPSSEVGRRPGSLLSLAYDTGGRPFVGTNAPGQLLKHIVQDASAYYLIGYAPAMTPVDGKFHKIKVRVKKSGYDVHARNGYFAPSLADMTRAREVAAAAELPPEEDRALGELTTASRADRPLELWVGMARGNEGMTRVTLAWAPGAEAVRQKQEPAASVTLSATAADGSTYYDATAPATQQVTFDAPPGEIVLKTSVRSENGEQIDAETRRIQVEGFDTTTLSIGTPVVLRPRTVSDIRAMQSGQDAPAWVGREFDRVDRLFIRFPLYGGDPPAPEAQLLNRQAKQLLTIPIARLPDGQYQIDLPLASIARGDYLISIEAARGDQSAKALVPIRVK
jgi:VWFA-related protein